MFHTNVHFTYNPDDATTIYGVPLTEPSSLTEVSELVTLQNEIISLLVGLARAFFAEEAFADTHEIMVLGLQQCILTPSSSTEQLHEIIKELKQKKLLLTPNCAMCGMCTRTHDYNMELFWQSEKEIQSIKQLLLCSLHTIVTSICEDNLTDDEKQSLYNFLYKGIFALGEDWSLDYMLSLFKEANSILFSHFAFQETIKEQTLSLTDPKSVALLLMLLSNDTKECSYTLDTNTLPPFLSQQLLETLQQQLKQ